MQKRPALALVAVLVVCVLVVTGLGFRIVDDLQSMHCYERARDGRTVALGDSITLGRGDPGWNVQGDRSWFSYATCDAAGAGADAGTRYGWNAGINGNTTEQMLGRFATDVAARRPRQVVVLGGTNDVFEGKSVDVAALHLADLVARAKALGARVEIGTIPPIDDVTRRGVGVALNDRIRRIAAAEHVTLVDFYAVLTRDGAYRKGWTEDGVHPLPSAAKAMGAAYLASRPGP